ncbi:putative transcription factor C2H2 family [Helianthus annuus]|nr:putative transcription factor C2H2 family [Helianthus annuus]KAJ0775008.1 putative transcription factor C2H2 family [Helianthus annuus]KAJ0937097.1 putative transcription factor C2H2 family [Helianthus annuus]
MADMHATHIFYFEFRINRSHCTFLSQINYLSFPSYIFHSSYKSYVLLDLLSLSSNSTQQQLIFSNSFISNCQITPIMDQWPDIDQQDSSAPDSLSEKLVFASIIMMILFIFIFILFIWLLPDDVTRHLNRQNRSIQYPNPRNRSTQHPNPQNQSTRIVYNNRPLAPSSSGLNASILKSLPLFVYSDETKTKTETNVDVVDCAVCLAEFKNGEKFRVLPNCKHCFHTRCIDMWFYNHSTCPLCRAPVEPVQKVPEPGPSAPFIGRASEEETS